MIFEEEAYGSFPKCRPLRRPRYRYGLGLVEEHGWMFYEGSTDWCHGFARVLSVGEFLHTQTCKLVQSSVNEGSRNWFKLQVNLKLLRVGCKWVGVQEELQHHRASIVILFSTYSHILHHFIADLALGFFQDSLYPIRNCGMLSTVCEQLMYADLLTFESF